MLAWYLRLGGADMWSRCDEEADIDREIMPVGGVANYSTVQWHDR
jgi:hypothetical protein